MAEDTGSEPVPPDIRPFGRSPHQTLQHAKHGRGPASINPSSSPPGDASSASFDGDLQSHSYEQSHEHHGARKRPKCAARTFGILLFGLALVALLPAAAASPLNITEITDGADPYTSYAQAAVRPADTYEWNRQPIISSVKWVFLHGIDAVAALTGVDVRRAGTRSTAYLGNSVFKREQLSTGQTVEAAITPVLVALSGMFAGLTLGYFSVDPTQLQVLSISGTPKQQEYARRIMPVRKDSHLLLTTLILGNMIVNEALPVVMDGYLGGGIQSVVISTALVVIFAEIIPQSVCSRYGLLIGASMAWPVRILIFLAFPIAWPIAKLLEYILGAHHGIIYRRSELRELIKMHAAGGEGGGDLDFDTVTMAQGALDLAGKTVKEAMTPIDSVFMLPIDAKLDYETLGHVVRSGHSRIPVYQMVEVPDINLSQPTLGPAKTKMVKKVLGSLLVKSCVLLDPEDATPLATIPINAIPSVPWDEPLTNMLNVFQEGRSHMAIVSRRPRRVENDPADAESVMTAAAGGLRQRFMRKVAEIAHGGSSGSDTDSSDSDTDLGKAEKATKKHKRSRRKSEAGKSSKGSVQSMGSPTSTVAAGSTEADKVKNDARATTASTATNTKKARDDHVTTEDKAAIPSNEKSGVPEKKKSGGGIAQAVQLTQLEQSVPADAQLPSELVDKFFDGLEGAPLGIITLEDVLEELIGEEIYDEYDAHGPRNPASAFVPREAALAAMQAAVAREKAKAEAAATQPAADAEAEQTQQQQQQQQPATKRTIIPKLPVKFSLGKKPLSQPGKSRTAPPVAAAPPAGLAEDTPSALPPIIAAGKPTFAEPEAIEAADIVSGGAGEGGLGSRSQSENRLSERRESSAPDLKSMRTGPGAESASAVPARLLPGGTGASGPGASAPAAVAAPNLLSEAILIERGRRRMAATGSPAPGVMRAPSAPGVSRALAITPAARVPTPPTGGSIPPKSSGSPAGPPGLGSVPHTPGVAAAAGSAAAGVIHSPQPVPAGKRGMFKSVPTPLPNTPVPGADYFDNKQDKDGRAELKGRKDEP